jgi:hypothetical protein
MQPRLPPGPFDLGPVLETGRPALEVHPRIAMAIIRHSRIAMTLEVHTQLPDKATRDALKRLSDFLGGPQDDDEEGRTDPPQTAA